MPQCLSGLIKFMFLKMKIIERSKKILIFGGILLGIIAFYTLLFEPLMKYEKMMKEDIALKEGLLNRYKATLEGRAELEVNSRRAKTLLERAKNRIFIAKTQALAAAQMQSIIQSSAGIHNITIKSINIKKVEKVEGYNTISLQLITYSNMRGLIDFLYDLETAARYINITSVAIKGEIVKEASRLDANLIVEGLADIES